MQDNSKTHFLPVVPPKSEKQVGIYARISTNSIDQLQSLIAQVSHLTRIAAATPQWLLVDVYIDVASSKISSSRKEFARMLDDCKNHHLEIILTKNISRFGRDTIEILNVLNQLKLLGVRVIFEQEDLDTVNTHSDLMVSIQESLAQSENRSRSESIKWGIKQRVADGSSKLYERKCYGYLHNADGRLEIDESEAKNVRTIFDLYLQGNSILGIVKELQQRGIKSPTGKDRWCKRTIDVMLSNEKYTGTVRLLNSGKHEMQYVSEKNNPMIISFETFQAVQIEKMHRSNVTQEEDDK